MGAARPRALLLKRPRAGGSFALTAPLSCRDADFGKIVQQASDGQTDDGVERAVHVLDQRSRREIGRASCRERV